MANVITRWVRAIFDAPAAKKTEQQLADSLTTAGKKGGAGFLRELRAAFDKKLADLKVQLAKGLIDPKEFKKQSDLAARTFNTGLVSGMEKARAAGTLTNTEYLKLSRTLKKVGDDGTDAGGRIGGAFLKVGSALASFFAIRKFVDFFAESIHNAIEAEDSTSRLDVVLKQLGLSYKAVSGEVEGYLTNLQATTRFSDEDGREALVNLIAATGDYKLSLSLLDVTANIAEKRHTSMADAAQTAANASRGLTKGMKDLGISTKESGDIVQKIQRNLGDLAKEAGTTTAGKIQILNNLWGEFKEKIGAAILGSDGLQRSSGGLQKALTDLNTWAEKNSGAISGFVDKLVSAAGALAKVGEFIVKHTPNLYTLGKAYDWVTGKVEDNTFADVEGQSTSTAAVAKGAKRRRELTAEELAERERREKELGAELDRIETQIAIRTLQVQQGLTEALATEMVRRRQLLAGKPKRETGTEPEVEKGLAELDRLNTVVTAGFDADLQPALSRTEEHVERLTASFAHLANAKKPAKEFTSTWIRGLDLIRNEVDGSGTLFAELGQAWAEGGLKGLADLAKSKVKENLAQSIEWLAKGIGLSIFNPGQASQAFTAAATYGAAAAAWGTLAGVSGGGGAGSASGAGGSGVGDNGSSLSSGSSLGTPQQEIHLYFEGPDVFNPTFQKQIAYAAGQAHERFGQNAKITIHRNGKP